MQIDNVFILNYREVAEVIISCDRWMEAMKHSFLSPITGIRETPIRLLIKHFPDLAKKVCVLLNIKNNHIISISY